MMSYILHMSDLHLGRNPELEQKQLTGLATWLTKQKIHATYLVFTGDMIDAPSLLSTCIRKLKRRFPEQFSGLEQTADTDTLLAQVSAAGSDCITFYNEQIREVTLHSMKRAAQLFLDFIHQIGVDNRNVILCCGNHDRMRLAHETDFDCGKTHCVDEDKSTALFEAYNLLCKMVNDKLSHRTEVYSQGGINFVIANSNWRAPSHGETNRMCVNCGVLSQKLAQLQQNTGFQRSCNLLIAHKPYDDFCENFKYPYAGEYLTVGDIVERSVTAFLFGDKHTAFVKINHDPKQFMCGSPLCNSRVQYNLLDFDPSVGVQSCSYILNDGSGWIQVPIMDCQEAVYNTSQPYLKGYAFDLLAHNRNVPPSWELAINLMQDTRDHGMLAELSELFAAFSELREGQPTLEIEKRSFFEQLVALIECSQLQALSIKGRPGIGKSTFITILYLYMFCLFSSGKTRYIPFYFNFDILTADLSDSKYSVKKYISYCYDCFSNYFSSCRCLSRQYGRPLCLFLDGLEKSKVLDPGSDTLESRIYKLLETQLNPTDRYMMCFNTHDTYYFEDTFEKIARFSYVVFMNRARVLPYKDNEQKLDSFLQSYLLLKRYSGSYNLYTFKCNLAKFRIPSIDLFFLDHCDKHIFSIQKDEKTWDVLKGHLENLEEISDDRFQFRTDLIQRAAGLLFSQRKCYTEIISSWGTGAEKPTITDFLSLLNVPDIANYLIAHFFVQELSRYSNLASEIPKDSILYSFIPYELAILVRLILDKKGSSAIYILARFIDHHSNELSGYLYSTISYLCGHLRTGDTGDLIKRLPPLDDKNPTAFFALCHRRSYSLAESIHNTSTDKSPVEDLLIELIDNETYRKFNRSYQLHYYQDRSSNSISNQIPWDIVSRPNPGFDFRYTFLILLSKLEQALLPEQKSYYSLMQLDLFTLCDLIYFHLQVVDPKGFFYSAKYNERNDSECESVLNRIITLLKAYNSLFGKQSNKITAYFSLMYVKFENARKAVSANKDKDIDVPYVSPCSDFEQVLRLSNLPRVGWMIDRPGPIKVEDQPDYQIDQKPGVLGSSMLESLMQHVMESVYIAQLFLPDTLSEEGFQKSKVITLLLVSELGKTNSGDYSPDYSNHGTRNRAEIAELARMSVLGALDGYAVQPTFLYLPSESSPSDVNMRICWEIKMIQREYKYYCLYDQLNFTSERREAFEKDFKEPITSVCKSIRKRLIVENPAFKRFSLK